MAATFFWLCLLALIYAFIGFPLTLKVLAKVRGRGVQQTDVDTPMVSMLLSVLNEEDVIEEKIQNFLNLDFPKERLELLIVSDGSTDGTEEIVSRYESEHVRLLVQEHNMGKTEALNRAAREARGDILVFTDANSMFDADAMTKLVAPFSDPEVGLVSGHTEYEVNGEGTNGGGAYRRYEDGIKAMESDLWGIVGADGAIYAMRTSLYVPMKPEHINDLLHPVQAILAGSRALQEQDAICREPLEQVGGDELRRQTRIMTQSWIIVFSQFSQLVRKERWGFLWQLVSHKILRWMTLPLMVVLFLANLALLGCGGLYVLTFLGQMGFYGAAYWFRNEDGGIKQLPYSFLLLHLSAVIGLYQYFKGERYIVWQPRNS